jgi:hypothetical protein
LDHWAEVYALDTASWTFSDLQEMGADWDVEIKQHVVLTHGFLACTDDDWEPWENFVDASATAAHEASGEGEDGEQAEDVGAAPAARAETPHLGLLALAS